MRGPLADLARAVVAPPDPTWADRAARAAVELADALGPAALRIDHIGSTAIPGMPAKDVLDLQVSVASIESADSLTDPLRLIGYEQAPQVRHDHVPAGLSDHRARWEKRFLSRRRPGADPVNLHVRVHGSPNERFALLFRDWFRAHPAAVPAYAAFKHALAELCPDVGAYTEVKDPVVDFVIVVAEEWALVTDWRPW